MKNLLVLLVFRTVVFGGALVQRRIPSRTGRTGSVTNAPLREYNARHGEPKLRGAPRAASAPGPNLLIILADDLGVGDVRSLPSVSKLAARGVNFTDAHSQPLCSPSRYALLSGRHPNEGRPGWSGWGPGAKSAFRDNQRSLAAPLSAAGYRTGFFGKWGVGGQPEGMGSRPDLSWYERSTWVLSPEARAFGHRLQGGPRWHGFETSLILPSGIQAPPFAWFRDDVLMGDPARDATKWLDPGTCEPVGASAHHHPGGLSVTAVFAGNRKPEADCPIIAAPNVSDGIRTYASDQHDAVLLQEARRFLRHEGTHTARPFFLMVSTAAVHAPYTPPRSMAGRFIAGETATAFGDMLLDLDALVSALVASVEEANLLNDTLIVFTSDNGGTKCPDKLRNSWPRDYWRGDTPYDRDSRQRFCSHASNNPWSSGPLRGYKGSVYEGGHRVPMVWSWPARLSHGTTFPGLVSHTDLYRTLLSFAGGKSLAAAAPADSYDISDMLLGPSKSRTKHSARSQLLVSNPQGGSFSVCLRLGSLKLIISTPRVQCVLGTRCDVPTVTEEMYNLAADLGEAHDLLKGDSRGCVEALREQCEHHAFKSAHENMESCAETSRALCVRRRVITAGFHGDVLVAHFLHQRLNMPNATST